MAKSNEKPRPTDQEALFLISMRRQRAKDIMDEILHGFTALGLKMPEASQLLDYLTNMVMCLEVMLKLLSEDWNSHAVGKMFETITGKPYHNPALMESLKSAVTDLKYLLPSAAGIVGHIRELEELHDELHRKLKEKHGERYFLINVQDDLPDDFGQYLLEKVSRFYKAERFTPAPGDNSRQFVDAVGDTTLDEIERIKSQLGKYLSNGHKLKMIQVTAQVI